MYYFLTVGINANFSRWKPASLPGDAFLALWKTGKSQLEKFLKMVKNLPMNRWKDRNFAA